MSVASFAKNPSFEKVHPRGKDGRFIHKGGVIRWLRKGLWLKGKVLGWSDDGQTIEVERILPGGKPGGKEQIPRAEVYADRSAKAYIDVKALTRTGQSTAGSNPAGIFVDPKDATQKFYVKQPKTKDHVRNEDLANRIYAALGFAVPETSVTQDEKQFASKMEPISGDGNVDSLRVFGPKMAKGFVVDAWLANWDVAVSHNLAQDADGNPFRVDNGGSMLFRARGERRDFGPTVGELQSMRSKPGYTGMTKADELEGAKKVIAITPDEIDELVTSSGLPDSLATTLKQRRKYIAKHYGLTLPEETDEGKKILAGLPEEDKALTPAAVSDRVDALEKVVNTKPAPFAKGSPVYLLGEKTVLADKYRGKTFIKGEITDITDTSFTVTSQDGKNSIELPKPDGDKLDGPGWAVMRPDGIPVGVQYGSGETPQIGDRVSHLKEGEGTVVRAGYPKYGIIQYDSGVRKASSFANVTKLDDGTSAVAPTAVPDKSPSKSALEAAFDKIGTRYDDNEIAAFQTLASGTLTPTKVFIPEYSAVGVVSDLSDDKSIANVLVTKADGGSATVKVKVATLMKPDTVNKDAVTEWRDLADQIAGKRRRRAATGPRKATVAKKLAQGESVTRKFDGKEFEISTGEIVVKATVRSSYGLPNGKKTALFRINTQTGAIDFLGPNYDDAQDDWFDQVGTSMTMWNDVQSAAHARWTDMTPEAIKQWNTEHGIRVDPNKRDSRKMTVQVNNTRRGGVAVRAEGIPAGDEFDTYRDPDKPTQLLVIRYPGGRAASGIFDRNRPKAANDGDVQYAIASWSDGDTESIIPEDTWEDLPVTERANKAAVDALSIGHVPHGITVPPNGAYRRPVQVDGPDGKGIGQWHITDYKGVEIFPPSPIPEIMGFKTWQRGPSTASWSVGINKEERSVPNAPTAAGSIQGIKDMTTSVKKTDEGVVFTWKPVTSSRSSGITQDIVLDDGTFVIQLQVKEVKNWQNQRGGLDALLTVNARTGKVELREASGKAYRTQPIYKKLEGSEAIAAWRQLTQAYEGSTGVTTRDVTPKAAIAGYTDKTIPQSITVSDDLPEMRATIGATWADIIPGLAGNPVIDMDVTGYYRAFGKAADGPDTVSPTKSLVVRTAKGDKPHGYVRVAMADKDLFTQFDLGNATKGWTNTNGIVWFDIGELEVDNDTVKMDFPDKLTPDMLVQDATVLRDLDSQTAGNLHGFGTPKTLTLQKKARGEALPDGANTLVTKDIKPWRPRIPGSRSGVLTADDVAEEVDTGNLEYKLPGTKQKLIDGELDDQVAAAYERARKAAGAGVTAPFQSSSRGNDSEGAYHNDVFLGELVRELGADDLPLVVDEPTFKAMLQARGIDSYHRGVGTAQQRDAQMTGAYFAGVGVYGNGTYGSTSRVTAMSYAGASRGSGKNNLLAEFMIKPETTVVEFDDMLNDWFDANVATGEAIMEDLSKGGIVPSMAEATDKSKTLLEILDNDNDVHLAKAMTLVSGVASANTPENRAAIITYVRAKRAGYNVTIKQNTSYRSSGLVVTAADGSTIQFVDPAVSMSVHGTVRSRSQIGSKTGKYLIPTFSSEDGYGRSHITLLDIIHKRDRARKNGDKDASIADFLPADRIASASKLAMRSGAISDPGRFALLAGIDAFEVQIGSYSPEKYVIVTHRGPLIYKKPKG